jgi:hypothetical protein
MIREMMNLFLKLGMLEMIFVELDSKRQ